MSSAAVEPGTVWSTLVGQRSVVETLSRAVAGQGMTHAWLFTGPPGSGRSVAARAFAAALLCPDDGCGHCRECRTALNETPAAVVQSNTNTQTLPIASSNQPRFSVPTIRIQCWARQELLVQKTCPSKSSS